MKLNSLKSTFVTAVLLLIILISASKAQNITVDTIQNTPWGEEYKDLHFRVGDSTIMKIGGDGNVMVNTNLSVDSILSTSGSVGLNSNLNMPDKWIHADSLRCRVIHVGDSSITIGNTPFQVLH